VLLVAGLGGFFSVYSILDQLTNHADPSLYRLVLLPMLRLVALTVTAYLLARAARGTRWWVVALPAIPCVTAAVAFVGTVQQPGLAAAGGAALLAATLPMVFAHPVAEVSDDTAC
jgi:peptidoglycan/LPS O-acetylase OafA/YrhL